MAVKFYCCVIFVILNLVIIKEVIGKISKADDFIKFVINAGYNAEAYSVKTEDGYILTLHRMYRKNSMKIKPPVFLQHGLFATSGDFIVTGRKKALAFLLADMDYDVWLGNIRGNKFSTKHKRLLTDSGKYWNFSFHEFGFYDLPAMINYMLKTTGKPRCFFVGHSQGTTSFIGQLHLYSSTSKKKR
jgi:pimeloyl-ACP methyl ester carboxylesterase